MGTRCLTKVLNENDEVILNMYRQHDGYPSGHGEALFQFLKGKKLCNGIQLGVDTSKLFNGIECLAASLVAHFKGGIGGIYLYSVNANNCGQEYEYTLSSKVGYIHLSVLDTYSGKCIYEGYLNDFVVVDN